MSEACCDHAAAPAPPPAVRLTGAERWLAWLVPGEAGLIGLAWLAAARGAHAASLALYAAAIALAAREPAVRAVRALGRRKLDINVLMIVAVAGAVALGDWLEAATVVWLFGVSEWLEARSLRHARRAVQALVRLAPADALVRRGGVEQRVLAIDVAPGDLVIVRPGERVPVDGLVVSGESAVDQAPVTGESTPAEKGPGEVVYAGAINGNGALEVEALARATDSTLSRIVRLVEQAQARRAPIQSFVDRFAARYTPGVVVLALAVAVVPPLAAGGAWSVWAYRALVLLVVACPCALVISTPVSFMSALTTAARRGVLVKGGATLERAAALRCVAFDKTGTLTRGRVRVTDVLGIAGHSPAGVLSVAAALEARSEHPIGRAIVEHARTEGLAVTPGDRYQALPGWGAEAHVADQPAIVGSHRLFEARALCTPDLHEQAEQVATRGGTAVLVGHGGAALGIIGLGDEVRATGRHAVGGLRREGIARVVLLTGDGAATGRAVGDALGLDEVQADLLPEDKVAAIERLRRDYGSVAMVGDGINDAPALAAADVGIAMGVAGSGVALETADVALMSDELEKLPYLIRLSRRTLRNVRWNVGIALGLKLAFVALAAAGLATLWMAVLADTGASLLVTANSLRLLGTK